MTGDRSGGASGSFWTRRRLRAANIVVGLVHAGQAVVVLWLASGFSIPVVADFATGPPGSDAPALRRELFEIPYGPVVAAFLALAALDHLLVAAPRIVDWYERNLDRGANYARWIEYSVSASLMIVLIAMLTGITGVYALTAIFVVNASMILFGLLMERMNPIGQAVRWAPFWFGCVAGAAPWIAIAIAVVGSEVEAEGVPTFVFAIFISLFILFNSFAVNMVLQYRGVGPWRDYRVGEAAYILLSLTAKSALAWQVFAGALAA